MSARKLAASSVANIGLHTNKAASSLLSLLPMVVVLTVLFFLLLPLLMVLVDALWWSSDQRSHGINLYHGLPPQAPGAALKRGRRPGR